MPHDLDVNKLEYVDTVLLQPEPLSEEMIRQHIFWHQPKLAK